MTDLIDDVYELIRLEKGDLGRLNHIKNTLEKGKPLYLSDEEYVKKLLNIKPTFEHKDESADDILKKRLAKGEISVEEFSNTKKILNEDEGKPTENKTNIENESAKEFTRKDEKINKTVKEKKIKKPMSTLKKIGIGIGITFALLIVIGIATTASFVNYMEEQTRTASESTIGKIKKIDESTMYSINDIIEVAGIAYKINSFVSVGYSSFENPDGTYMGVDVTIENLRDKTTSVYNDQFTLIDEKGRQFNAEWVLGIQNSLNFEELQPNLPINRIIVFDIPYDNQLQYKLLIKPGTYEVSSDKANVCVKNC